MSPRPGLVYDPDNVEEVLFAHPSAKPKLQIAILRRLTVEDVDVIENERGTPQPTAGLQQVRTVHHELARQMALGEDLNKIAFQMGYSPSYLSSLKKDPAFMELLAYYGTQREIVYSNVLRRMETLGLSGIDELQRRFEEDSSKWTNREILDMSELMVLKPMQVTASTRAAGAQVSGGNTVNIKFVSAERPEPSSPIIEHDPKEISDDRN